MSRRKKEARKIKAKIGEELRRDRATLRRERSRINLLWYGEGIPLPLALIEVRNRTPALAKKRF